LRQHSQKSFSFDLLHGEETQNFLCFDTQWIKLQDFNAAALHEDVNCGSYEHGYPSRATNAALY